MKSLLDFYRHPQMGDGHLNFCMVCVRKRAAAHRLANIDRLREYDRGRGFRVYDRNKVKARNLTKIAIGQGILKVRPCERCGFALGVEAHHEDYDKPLEIVWLCKKHHAERHIEINAERRQRVA
jgi:hypothetical protein